MSGKRLAIVGCGLMGGSFALAARARHLVDEVVGYSPSAHTREAALAHGVIDQAVDTAQAAMAQADVVLLAVPVGATADCLSQAQQALAPHALLMDVGSTKGNVVQLAQQHLGQRLPNFVPCHPIAGKERAGVQHAEPNLYMDRRVIVTATADTADTALTQAQALWQGIGAQVTHMSAEAHDAAFAGVSHVPHLLAFAYMLGMLQQPQANEWLRLAGPGFRDFTRIAASDPTLWRDVLLANRDHVLTQTQSFEQALHTLTQCLTHNDAQGLQALIAQAGAARTEWTLQAD
ncbi:MAG: prephenate dehydrogenase/arogenate dehydrogenase family protein [Proteobacteria bacterium]|nr:prephenate dehydrogenase/arogenate dehydrogenase family protein [Pseudomonadota bacterium]MDA0868479.1 prephenate dehydrogenase/arogenate dehydrogenase family protein [Pseudomonadota bacterium]MDA1327447.1 prephenate dehydrogenase/arogenate dehydrogenase family protein [Pseudomonadota bacterium]